MDSLQLIESLTASISLSNEFKEAKNVPAQPFKPTLRHASCLHPVKALPTKYEIDHTNSMTTPAYCLKCSINAAKDKTISIVEYHAPLLNDADLRRHPERHIAVRRIELRRNEEILILWRSFGATWTGVERNSGRGIEVLNMYISSLDGMGMKLVMRWQTCEDVCMITGEQEVIEIV